MCLWFTAYAGLVLLVLAVYLAPGDCVVVCSWLTLHSESIQAVLAVCLRS